MQQIHIESQLRLHKKQNYAIKQNVIFIYDPVQISEFRNIKNLKYEGRFQLAMKGDKTT